MTIHKPNLLHRLSYAYTCATGARTALWLCWFTTLFSLALRWPWLYRWWQQNQNPHTYTINFRGNKLQLQLRPQDLPIFYEIFQDQAYQLPATIGFSPKTIIWDLGAHVGLFSIWFQNQYSFVGQILAVEPAPQNFSLLQVNTTEFPNIKLVQQAVAPSAGEVFLTTDTLSYNHHINKAGIGLKVTATTFSELFDAYPLSQKINLLKMDVEGQEALLIPQLRPHVHRIQYLLLEIHPPYSVLQLKEDLDLTAGQCQLLHSNTYLINLATDEFSTIPS